MNTEKQWENTKRKITKLIRMVALVLGTAVLTALLLRVEITREVRNENSILEKHIIASIQHEAPLIKKLDQIKWTSVEGAAIPNALVTLWVNGEKIDQKPASADGSFDFEDVLKIGRNKIILQQRYGEYVSPMSDEYVLEINFNPESNVFKLDPYPKLTKEHLVSISGQTTTYTKGMLVTVGNPKAVSDFEVGEYGKFKIEDVELGEGKNVFYMTLTDASQNATLLTGMIEINCDTTPPKIEDARIENYAGYGSFISVPVVGKTDPDATIIWGNTTIKPREDGSFYGRALLPMLTGYNEYPLIARDSLGNKTVVTLSTTSVSDKK